ncbi:hypothetical protein BKA61DRAFT_579971 [Leptodontidium sp. MPI-SDFR-AT-0119]|nr:hypothetical protein BKA61DRAFT_579971 [Leptodontidium sp. MPI-SDFR-AT-0119]
MISECRRKELGLKMRHQYTSFPMGSSKRIYSPGTVEVPIAFEDDRTNIITIVAHVVHKFVPCLFSLKSRWSFNLLGETTHRLRGRLGAKGLDILALMDIGSVRNVMNAEWAMARAGDSDFEILSGPENCGWMVFPDGTEEATIGQARTTMTLPDGEIVPVVFELLPNCYMNVVLGQDKLQINNANSGDELMPMGYIKRRFGKKTKKGGAVLYSKAQEDDLNRQVEWNLKYEHGRTAPIAEWNQENTRREEYERS